MEIAEVKEAVKGVVADGLDPLTKKLDGVEARLKAVEESPMIKTPAIITSPKEIHGRKIAKQGHWFRKQGMKEEVADGLAKFLVGVALRKGMDEATDANGGFLVPDEYAMEMIALARNSSFALQACRVMNMGSDVLKVPTELSLGSATWVAESTEKTANEPTFGQATLTAKKLINLAVASNELIADGEFDIASLLAEQFAYSQAQELDNQLFNGTGDPVSGILTAAAGYSVVIGAGASMSTVTAVDLSRAIANIEEGYLGGSRFFFGRLAMHYVRSLKDSQNRPIYAEIGGASPRTIYEYPVNVSEKIANVDGANKALGVFGNFDKFLLGRRAGSMVIEADPYTRFAYADTRFRMVSRWAFAYGKNTAFTRILASA